jgi:hypothetical protein
MKSTHSPTQPVQSCPLDTALSNASVLDPVKTPVTKLVETSVPVTFWIVYKAFTAQYWSVLRESAAGCAGALTSSFWRKPQS